MENKTFPIQPNFFPQIKLASSPSPGCERRTRNLSLPLFDFQALSLSFSLSLSLSLSPFRLPPQPRQQEATARAAPRHEARGQQRGSARRRKGAHGRRCSARAALGSARRPGGSERAAQAAATREGKKGEVFRGEIREIRGRIRVYSNENLGKNRRLLKVKTLKIS